MERARAREAQCRLERGGQALERRARGVANGLGLVRTRAAGGRRGEQTRSLRGQHVQGHQRTRRDAVVNERAKPELVQGRAEGRRKKHGVVMKKSRAERERARRPLRGRDRRKRSLSESAARQRARPAAGPIVALSGADERSGVRDGHPYSTAVVRRSLKRATVRPPSGVSRELGTLARMHAETTHAEKRPCHCRPLLVR